jgi:hypothetical protein
LKFGVDFPNGHVLVDEGWPYHNPSWVLLTIRFRTEKYIPPWDERTEFYKLRKQLDDFQDSLPQKLKYTSTNLAAHVGGSSMTVYTAIHTLIFLCEIVLHREYVPFIPLRCDGPVGPLDEPTFPTNKFEIPEGFWEESAEAIFRAASNIMEIVRANSGRGFFIESPQVGFAIWTAAFVGVYSINFPHMDAAGHMIGRDSHLDFGDLGDTVKGATGLAVRTLTQMSSKMKMAYGWSKTIKRMHEYFVGIIKDHRRSLLDTSSLDHQSRAPAGQRKLSLREGGRGGGLEEYKLLEKELKEFGTIEEDESNSTPPISETTGSRASTAARSMSMTPNIKPEPMQGLDRHAAGRLTSDGSWAAVNNTSSNGVDEAGRPVPFSMYGPAQGPTVTADTVYFQTHHRPKGPTSAPPSLTGAQSSPSDLNSSFGPAEHINTSAPATNVYAHSSHPAVYHSNMQQQHMARQNDPWPPHAHMHTPIQPSYMKTHGGVILGGSQIAGFSDGLPFDMWATDGDASYSQTDFMETLWNPQPPFFAT